MINKITLPESDSEELLFLQFLPILEHPALGDLRGLAAIPGALALEDCKVLLLGDPVIDFEIFGSGELQTTFSSTVLDMTEQLCKFSFKLLSSDLVSDNILCRLVLLCPEQSLLDPESRRLLILDGGLLSPSFEISFLLLRFFCLVPLFVVKSLLSVGSGVTNCCEGELS